MDETKNEENGTPMPESGQDPYRLLVESIKDYAIILLDPQGHITLWNQGAQRIKGYTAEEVIGKHFSLFYTPDAVERGYPDYELASAKVAGRHEDEGWRVRKDGTLFWANVVITPVYGAANGLVGYSKVTRDLTDRRNAEEQLRKSEERYRLLIEGVKDYAIFMLDPRGYIVSWNEGARRLKGYSEKEIIGQHFSIFYPREAVDIGFPEFELQEALKQGRFEDEGERIRKDGSRFIANVILTPIYNRENQLLGYSKVTRDLTERKSAEEDLRKSEERHRLLIEAVKDYAIFMLDPEGRIISWNEGAKRLKGYLAPEIIGKHFSTFYLSADRDRGYPDYELAQAKVEGRYEDEGWRVRKDGSVFFANVVITAVYNVERKLLGFSKITRDLTERKRAEDALTHLNAQLENRVWERTQELSETITQLKRINNDMDNFVYTASHDLKAPIANIEGLLAILTIKLQKKGLLDQDLGGLLEKMTQSVSKFQAVIKDLAEVNQTQQHGKDEPVTLDLPEIIAEVTESIANMVEESGAVIQTDSIPTEARIQKMHSRSILFNLLSNAIKYRSPDRPLTVKVKGYPWENFYVMEVADNGLGIRPENQEKIFQLFKRLHSHVEGTGIGLYIVRRIVDHAGGKIEVESSLGEGSTFRIYWPVQ